VSHATSSRAVRVSTSAVAGAGAATAAEGARAMCRRPREGAVEGARGAALGAVDGHADAIMVGVVARALTRQIFSGVALKIFRPSRNQPTACMHRSHELGRNTQ
jgi:hypothetical protein